MIGFWDCGLTGTPPRLLSWVVRRAEGRSPVGIEYRLRFEAPDNEAVADVLRRLPAARTATQQDNRFGLGDAGHDWTQATVEIEPGGVYYCDHCGGSGRALLGAFPWELVERIGVFDQAIAEQVAMTIQAASHQPIVGIERSWYF